MGDIPPRFICEALDVSNLNAALVMAVRAGIVTVPKDEEERNGWKVAA